MRLHGGYEPAIWVASASPQGWVRHPPALGYRNLFGPVCSKRANPPDPTRQDAFHGYGFAEGECERTVELLKKLAIRMQEPFSWNTVPANTGNPDDNPTIPAGYTYLAQLVAHDLTFVGSTLPSANDSLLEQRNLRTIALNLETIYGGGPLERPSSFNVEAKGGPRYKLRLGAFADVNGQPPTEQVRRAAFTRDVPRAACPMGSNDDSKLCKGLTEVLISDPRNDDHLIIAQTSALFHLLHNAAADILAAHPGWESRRLFAAARRLVTEIYREIVRSDLMKRLLCAPVYERYTRLQDPLIDKQGDTAIPVEFSHATFRVGHAMIRTGYRLRDFVVRGLDDMMWTSSQALPDRMPPDLPWIIRWSNFYQIDETGIAPNLSRRMSPSFTRALFTSDFFKLSEQETGLDPAQDEMLVGLPRRDLARGATVYMRSVESLIRRIGDAAPDLVAGSKLLSDRDYRRETIARHLAAGRIQATDDRFSEEDLKTLAADPPLFFFVLLEAAVEQDGLRLGRLGSVIVAEVIFRALGSPAHFEAAGVPDAGELLELAFPDGTPNSMPKLIRFLDRHYGFQQNGPAFA